VADHFKSTIDESVSFYDYNRTVVAFHGTSRRTAETLVSGVPFRQSENEGDWLGHGIYFWENAPQQAWTWAKQRHKSEAAVVGALVRLGRCIDLFDPTNTQLLDDAHENYLNHCKEIGRETKSNVNANKYLDCAIWNHLALSLQAVGQGFESARAVFVPQTANAKQRLWARSGVLRNAHIQVCIRQPKNILASQEGWSVWQRQRRAQRLRPHIFSPFSNGRQHFFALR
jgi:hypothetical protein